MIGEYKGKQELFKEQSPQLLETLRQVAVIQSTESSNRIEGITAPSQRLRQLVAHKATPQNRSEQKLAGYRDVLNTIHANYRYMPFTSGLVLQLHRDLTQFNPSQGGIWKQTDNDILETRPDGTRFVRFKPVPAYLTPDAMRQLHERFDLLWRSQETEPLLLIATYVLDFLCIHPFLDGNGRMARLLTLLLLYQAGYEVGRYISLEQIIEKTRESYYDTLYQSSQGWHERQHSLLPWWEYFLGTILGAYRTFEEQVGVITTNKGAKREMVVSVVDRLPKQFQLADVERACPGVSRPTINRALAQLRRENRIICIKAGRDAVWEKVEESS
jgi:Fic family protein